LDEKKDELLDYKMTYGKNKTSLSEWEAVFIPPRPPKEWEATGLVDHFSKKEINAPYPDGLPSSFNKAF
jgi:hypothetical protein